MQQPPRKLRYTIGQLMAVIAVLSGVLAVPRLIDSPQRPFVIGIAGVLIGLVLLGAFYERVFGRLCPACSRRALRRLARHRRYYRCSACRARFKRFGFGPWLDASGPEDAGRYRGHAEAGTWKGYAEPEELHGSTSGVLLGSKRSRDLPGEARRLPPRPPAGRRLEAAERKVRKFLKSLHDEDE